ncbi:MAG: NAD(P)(+) transhydrogenase (Re/Si-specific) subunit alpha, partial [Arthrobacter sp.]
MKLGIPRERREGERRVAATPDTVRQLVAMGLDVLVETGAGDGAGHADAGYQQAGATIVPVLDTTALDVL